MKGKPKKVNFTYCYTICGWQDPRSKRPCTVRLPWKSLPLDRPRWRPSLSPQIELWTRPRETQSRLALPAKEKGF